MQTKQFSSKQPSSWFLFSNDFGKTKSIQIPRFPSSEKSVLQLHRGGNWRFLEHVMQFFEENSQLIQFEWQGKQICLSIELLSMLYLKKIHSGKRYHRFYRLLNIQRFYNLNFTIFNFNLRKNRVDK